jgi:hypothetical protein
MRGLADAFWGRLDESTFDPGGDRYFTIGAVEQEYPKGNVGLYLKAGKRSWSEHEHTHWNNGYNELNYGLYPIHARDAFDGPFRIPGSSPTPLVVATTPAPSAAAARTLGVPALGVLRPQLHVQSDAVIR